MGSMHGRTVIVTGGAQGLGRAYAELLAGRGAAVGIVDLDGELAEGTAAAIRAQGGTSLAVTADVANSDQVKPAAATVAERLGPVDVLVNNAGGALYPTAAFDTFSESAWDRVIDVNLKGTWLWSRAVTGTMRERGRGRIINITSTVVFRGAPEGMAPYGAAKAGIIGLTRMLARELGQHGITVNAVAPGYTPVPTRKDVHTSEAADRLRTQMIDEQCLKRSTTPEDPARAVAFLASDEAAFITGQVLSVDGGWTLR